MIHPVDVPVLFAERRRYLDNESGRTSGSIVRRNAYGQCITNKITTTVLPQVVLQRGMTLWNNLFKETSRLPVTWEEQKDTSDELHDRILFPDPVEPPTLKSPLELRIADLFVEKNALNHHTADFDVVRRENDKKLVIRRGQPFVILLLFYRDIDGDVDQLKLVFEIGIHPTVSNCTRSILVLPLKQGVSQRNPEGWYAKVQSLSANQLELELKVSPNCVIGRWNLKVVTSLKSAPRSEYQNSTSLISDIYIFFNPWNKEDTVYMESAADVDEYVLNDVGKIWRGSVRSPRPYYWSFGQYEEGVLEACVKVLNRCALPYPMRSLPSQVVRALADMVQSPEEYSILEGLWAADFFSGTVPADWTGSSKILQQYIKTGRTVSYGHCWVFAGVMTTICRCLGIPTRIVTGYETAHDSQKFVAVDFRVNRSGEVKEDYPNDNIWTYHVWNECWMKRPDLMIPEYDGWQVVDSTPQEKGGGLTKVGPTSVRALKEGRIDLLYDAANVISEINADKFYWVEDDIGEEHLVGVAQNEIGLMLSTKRPGRQFTGFTNDDRLDLTDKYKLDKEKRSRVFEAILPGYQGTVSTHLKEKIEDVKFELQMKNQFSLGDDIDFKVLIENTSNQPREINMCLRFEALHFVTRSNVRGKQEHCRMTVPPKDKIEFSSILLLNEYLNQPGQYFTFLAVLRAVVSQTQQTFLKVQHFMCEPSNIQISVLDVLRVGKVTEMELVFLNPLPITLTGCKFIIDGPGILEVAEVTCKNVHPRAAAKARYSLQPFRARKDAVIIVLFSCDQLKDVSTAIGTRVEN